MVRIIVALAAVLFTATAVTAAPFVRQDSGHIAGCSAPRDPCVHSRAQGWYIVQPPGRTSGDSYNDFPYTHRTTYGLPDSTHFWRVWIPYPTQQPNAWVDAGATYASCA